MGAYFLRAVRVMRNLSAVSRVKSMCAIVVVLLCAGLTSCGASVQIMEGTPPAAVTLAFAAPVSFASGVTSADLIAVGDFNGDGKLDFAVAGGSNEIAVFLNEGNGAFGAPKIFTFRSELSVGSIAVGDLNQDGKLDLVVAGNPSAIVLLGNGDGTFVEQVPISGTSTATEIAVADVNHDGHLDIVETGVDLVTAFLGNGDGTFAPGVSTFMTGNPETLWGTVIGDFNGDGKLDVVEAIAANVGTETDIGSLVFFAGNGDGTFKLPVTENITAQLLNTIIGGDFNGDGKQDLVMGTLGSAFLMPGNGDGTFPSTTSSTLAVGGVSASSTDFRMRLATADFDLDGRPDVVIGGVLDGTVQLSLNSAQGFGSSPTGKIFNFTLDPGLKTVAAGDLNGDGLPDIIVCNAVTGQISIILSQKQ
jgi:FG-GAP-like repeat